ncbi:MAG: hypothetical protein LBQ49_00205 [Rickettsiales bacterium]|jgi:hypothetical protein|nr:hypothetical protein [Rickettsiales bacterium]
MKNQEPFLSGYKSLSIPICDKSGQSAWPEAFDRERIEELRKTVGPRHFSAQMMLNFIGADKARLDPGALIFYDDEFDPKTAKLGRVQITGRALYWDPSSGRKSADGSVVVLVLRNGATGDAYIHDCIYITRDEDDRHPLTTQCARVLEFMRANGAATIAIEVNGMGGALPEIIRKEAAYIGAHVNVIEVKNHRNKVERILDAIDPLINSARLHAHEKIKETDLIDEMAEWSPDGWTRDDGLDALAGALDMTPLPVRPHFQRIRIYSAQTEFKF